MVVSSNSLFHFLNSKKTLISIIQNGIAPAYCYEEFTMKDKKIGCAVPIISFCDIPLSQVKEHVKKYGGYGIGFSIDWGVKNGLNPVLYIEKNSRVAHSINKLGDYLVGKMSEGEEFTEHDEATAAFFDLVVTAKNYKGDLKRNKKIYKNYKFYDEREWRYIADTMRHLLLPEEDYLKYRKKNKVKKILYESAIRFKANDIKYIIVKHAKEIPSILKGIQKTMNLGDNYDEIEILGTKILTVKQLFEDF